MRAVQVLAICAAATIGTAVQAQEIDWKKVDEAIGRSAATVSGDVHRYGFPRTDLEVTLDGVKIKPALALGGWAAFKPAHGGAMVMGDLVLLETEINPVLTKLIAEATLLLTPGIPVVGEWFQLRLVYNRGAAFGLHVGPYSRWVFFAVAVLAVFVLNRMSLHTSPGDRLRQLALAGDGVAGAVCAAAPFAKVSLNALSTS